MLTSGLIHAGLVEEDEKTRRNRGPEGSDRKIQGWPAEEPHGCAPEIGHDNRENRWLGDKKRR